jgi:RHS repeat-associated protein
VIRAVFLIYPGVISSVPHLRPASPSRISSASPPHLLSRISHYAVGTNRFSNTQQAMGGVSYDGAGNILNDGVNQYLYDGEGRICAVSAADAEGEPVLTGYLYNAEGERVSKGSITAWSCDPGVNGFKPLSDYVVGLSGEQVTEMGINPSGTMAWQHTNVYALGKMIATYDNDGLHFYLNDPLGTRRAQTDYAGVLEQSCLSLPFGDALNCTNSTQYPTEHHFTGKERDTESGNDYFGDRYYASSMGRWMSPDPIWVTDDRLVDPQRLNLYSYVENKPLTLTDPHGDDVTLGACASGSAQSCFNQVQAGLAKDDRSHVHLVAGDGKNGFAKGVNGITVDQDYKSDSKNFQVLQSLAGDHSATARVDVLNSNDQVTIKVAVGYNAKTGNQYQESPISPGNPSKNDGFEGYTFFPLGDGPGPYSDGNYTDVVVNNSDSGRGGVPASIHHELRHVFLGDFGRSASKALHGTGNVDQQTKAAEDEAIKNQKDKP